MSIRKEVIGELYSGAAEKKIIPLYKGAAAKGKKRLDLARTEYEGARKEVLWNELARYYRVGIFGSARLDRESPEYKFVTSLAKGLVEARDVDIVTGGGRCLMEAANYGHWLAIDEAARQGRALNSRSHGTLIQGLPQEIGGNDYIHIQTAHPEFPTRIQELLDKTQAGYIAHSGIGGLLEKLMLVQAKQVGHLESQYLIIAHPFWEPVVNSWNDELYYKRQAAGRTPTISEEDLSLVRFSDNIPDIVDMVSQSYDNWKINIHDRTRKYPSTA